MNQGVKDVKDDGHGNPDKKSCHVLSVALGEIVRHSANVNFRDRCFAFSRSGSSSGVQAVLAADLLSIVSRDHSARARKKQARTTEDETARDTRDQDPGD